MVKIQDVGKGEEKVASPGKRGKNLFSFAQKSNDSIMRQSFIEKASRPFKRTILTSFKFQTPKKRNTKIDQTKHQIPKI